jgi:hypothetical protein
VTAPAPERPFDAKALESAKRLLALTTVGDRRTEVVSVPAPECRALLAALVEREGLRALLVAIESRRWISVRTTTPVPCDFCRREKGLVSARYHRETAERLVQYACRGCAAREAEEASGG